MPVKKKETTEDFVDRLGEMIIYFMDIRGNHERDCQALAEAVKNEIRKEFKGERVSIRQPYKGTPHADKIATEYNGSNMDEIRERYGVSRSTVYRCLNR